MTYVETWAEWANRSSKVTYSPAIHPAGNDPEEWYRSGLITFCDLQSRMNFPYCKSVLEYGCGNGRILTHFKNMESYGVDITPQFVEEANELGMDTYLLDDFKKEVDIVYSMTVFIHLNEERTRDALKYIYEHLKPGGRAYLQIYIFKSIRKGTTFTDVNCLDLPTYKKLISEIGFKEIHTDSHDYDWDWSKVSQNKYSLQILEK